MGQTMSFSKGRFSGGYASQPSPSTGMWVLLLQFLRGWCSGTGRLPCILADEPPPPRLGSIPSWHLQSCVG